MYVSRKSVWGRTSAMLALALSLTMFGCTDNGNDDEPDGGGNPDAGVPEPDAGPPITATLTGRVTYDFVPAILTTTPTRGGMLAFAQTSVRPVRNATVQVMRGTTVLGTATTDEDGRYQLTYTAGTGANLTLATLAKTTTPAIQVEDNTARNAIWAVSATITGGTTSRDLHAGHGWTGSSYNPSQRVAAPFAILDSMYTASRAFLAVRTVPFPPLKVNWSPNNIAERNNSGDTSTGQIGTSHFSPSENEIYVLGKEGADTDEFDDHVIVHEWGHYFESNLSRSDNPGGQHIGGDVLDPRIAFGEGYGNALSAILLPDPLYVDTSWGAGRQTAFGFDMETASTDDPTPSAFSEFSVMRLLYDIFDASSAAEASYDQVNIGLGTLYDVLVGPQKTTPALTTIGSFIHGLKAQPGINAAALDTLAAHYQIGSIRSAFGEGDTQLAAMYTTVSSLPYNANGTLTGGKPSNQQQQNRYYVFNGTGRTVIISANSTEDVGIQALQQGTRAGFADDFLRGTESFRFSSQADRQYVLIVTGFKDSTGTYNYSVSITSP
ncbi:hypothetical protein HUA78_33575 [Myxococcus sp. CA033]|uniref:hypothetical protein n=1 Tax=Myxococcus sp. CA033 TaxID=2741516 RepID=UPI00157AA12B|nr:hypothetical protein [Myxococcus sp. CA033]NTX39378.1 hypothetical protein [Myxococcus sp. CA033]